MVALGQKTAGDTTQRVKVDLLRHVREETDDERYPKDVERKVGIALSRER